MTLRAWNPCGRRRLSPEPCRSGRDAALAALAGIDSADQLRLLAREQWLAVPADVASAQELRAAIVTAAERRIANRIAAAS